MLKTIVQENKVENNKSEIGIAQKSAPISSLDVSLLGTPLPIFSHFNIDISSSNEKDRVRLKEIYSWANDDGVKDIGDMLLKIKTLENSLGSPTIGESRVDRVWRWVALQNRITDLRKQQDSIKGI